MVAQGAENRILKYLNSEATSEDLDFLSDWILIDENQEVFETYVQTHFEITTAMNKPDIDKIKNRLLRQIKKDKKRRFLSGMMKYAAVVLFFLALGYVYQVRFSGTEPGVLVPKEEAITITLGDGTVETLDSDENKKIIDDKDNVIGSQKKSQLIYEDVAKAEKIVYNTLHVPYGRRFDVILSDDTQVFLNSGTSLRYPVAFVKGNDRKVFLAGEAYFDVAKDKKHPFVVHTDAVDIKVLGTKFNVSHYPEDANINTVLVEGSVELHEKAAQNGDNKTLLLKPGFKAEWHQGSNEISIENVDTRLYTAWVQGKLIFRNTTFRQIRQALERKYNVTIKNKNEDLDEQLFDATFDIETIEEVLESFSKSYAIDYKIVENEVIIE